MFFRTKKDIPPGLITVVRKEKGFKKSFFLIGLSAVMIVLGFVSFYLYNYYLIPETKKSNQPRLQISEPSPTLSQNPQTQPIYAQSEQSLQKVKSDETKSSAQLQGTKNAENTKDSKIKSKEIQNPLTKEKPLKSISTDKQERKTIEIPLHQFNTDTLQTADYLYRAQDFELKGNCSDAISEYKEYLRVTGKQDPKILDKIATLYLLIGNLKEAFHYSQIALNQAPDNVSIIINYGVIHAKMGNISVAEECFRKVLSMNPENKTALYNLALLKERKKQYEEALKLYEKLYQLGDPQAAEAIQRIRSYK